MSRHAADRLLLRTDPDAGPLIARIALGLTILPHGAQKLLGWFGGPGFSGTMQFFTEGMGIPWLLALLVILAESFGALALVVGFLGRAAALGLAAVMVGAVLTVHAEHGFFMNWTGAQAGEGFEFHVLALGLALIVMVEGSGAWSVDRMLAERAGAAFREEPDEPRSDPPGLGGVRGRHGPRPPPPLPRPEADPCPGSR